MTRWTISLMIALSMTGCSRPEEVRSLASAALPLAARLKASAEAQQALFVDQRATLDRRAAELGRYTTLARDASRQIEQDWRFVGDTASLRKIAQLREEDAALLADPLASVSPTAATAISKPPAFDMTALNIVVSNFDGLRQKRKLSEAEIISFAQSMSDKLGETEGEQAKQTDKDAITPP